MLQHYHFVGAVAWLQYVSAVAQLQYVGAVAQLKYVSAVTQLHQSCRRLPNFGRSPEFRSFQKIAQNFCAIFKIGQKRSKKLSNATKTLEKLPK